MRLLRWIIGGPMFVLALIIALANRDWIQISFDPFMPSDPLFAIRMPLYLALFASLLLGMVLGGAAAWISRPRT